MLTVNKKRLAATITLSSVLLLSACNMRDIVEEEGKKASEKTEESEQQQQDGSFGDAIGLSKNEADLTDEEMQKLNEEAYELSEEQLEKLEEAEFQTVDEAVTYNNSNLVQGTEVTLSVPQAKSAFTDRGEAAQYFSYLFFQYHTNLIDGKTFYQKIKPHMAKQFIELLPAKEADRESMFVALQKLFTEQLEFKIEKYAMTEVEYNGLTNEGTFQRKYTLYNGDEIFYKTLITEEDGVWKIVDDKAGEGYTTQPYKESFIKTNK